MTYRNRIYAGPGGLLGGGRGQGETPAGPMSPRGPFTFFSIQKVLTDTTAIRRHPIDRPHNSRHQDVRPFGYPKTSSQPFLTSFPINQSSQTSQVAVLSNWRAAICSPAGQLLRHKSRLYGLDLAGNRPKSITSRRSNKMETKHRWRPATLPHGGKMLAACSRQAIRFCYRCNSLQCHLGSHCSECTALSQQPCEPLSVKRGAPEKPADPSQPRRKATQQAYKQWNEDLRSQRRCPNCKMTCLVTCRTAATAKPLWGTVKNRSCKLRKWNPRALPAEGGYCRRMSRRSAGMGFRPSLTAHCIADGIVSCRQRSRCINPSLVV